MHLALARSKELGDIHPTSSIQTAARAAEQTRHPDLARLRIFDCR